MTASHISGAGLGLDFLSHRHNGVVDSSQNISPPYGQELIPTPVVPISSTVQTAATMRDPTSSAGPPVEESQALSRHGTLLSANAPLRRNAAELSSILGDSTSRLRPGAIVLPLPGQHDQERTSLEQAKTRPRVKVDIILNSYTYVQGGYLQGYVNIKIFECARTEVPVMISGGKVRVIGYESISNQLDKYPFYRCSSPLETVTRFSGEYHDLYRDSEGFAQAIEGEYMLPFSMYLPMSADHGTPKGSIQAEVTVRYIAMVCEIWPRFDPSIILAPDEKPWQAEITMDANPCLASSHGINLTASVHRLHWVAGQQCFVKVFVANESKRLVKSLSLALIRDTTVFKPSHRTNTSDGYHDEKYDACSVSTNQKLVTESVLEMGRRSSPRHASARDLALQYVPDSLRYDSDDDSAEEVPRDIDLDPSEDLQCFIDEDDADKIFPRILQDDPQFENAPRFADLYYASVQDPELSSVSHQEEEQLNRLATNASEYQANLVRQVEEYALLRSGLHPNYIPPTRRKSDLPKGPPSFASRVQAKLAAAAEASSPSGCDHVFTGSWFSSTTPSSSAVTDTSPCRESAIGHRLGNPHYPRQPDDHVPDATVSSGPLGRGDKDTVLTALSTFSPTNSLPYSEDSPVTSGESARSKPLPKPPAMIDMDSAGCRMCEQACTGCRMHGSTLHAAQLHTFSAQFETNKTPDNPSQHQEQASEPKEETEIDESRLGLNRALERETGALSQPSKPMAKEQKVGATSNESMKSVKERIRELEERQKVLQLNEANGVRSFA
ncbi:hypothetical protein C0993_008617 [Termitomyces sp. T159_Od127]|nr:hypothetical protein C0993_008617 [Termitomyces sp. T159_Od127]